MKLRSLLVGFIGMILFAACSNEGELGNPVIPATEEGEATLSVMISNPQTKAVGGPESDLTIKDLCVLIFKGTGDDARLEKIGWQANGSASEVKDIPVTSGNKKVVVLANVKDLLTGANTLTEGENGTTYAAVKGMSLGFSEREVNGSLSMSSKTYDVTLRVSMKNYLGYTDKTVSETGEETLVTGSGVDTPVNLYRNVARVVLNKIAFEKNPMYPDFKLDVKEVFILHGHKQSTLIGDGTEWGTTVVNSDYLNGVSDQGYRAWVAKIEAGKNFFPYLTDKYSSWTKPGNTYVEAYDKNYTGLSKPSFYVYENTNVADTDAYTLLVVKGDFSFAGQTAENRYYSIAVGVSGVGDGYRLPDGFTARRNNAETYKGVLRNLSYLVDFTVKGPGYDTPFTKDDTYLTINCRVVNQFIDYEEEVGGE